MSSAQDKTAGYEPSATPAAGTPVAGQARGDYPRDDYDSGTHVAQAGFTVLAATLMILSGLFSFLEGLAEIFRTSSVFTTLPNYTYQFSVHSWGWVHLGVGIVIFAAGACVLLGQPWARAVGIVLAVFSGIANFLFLPYYPIWSIIVIAIDVFIIWALATGMSRRATA
jgi:hypothetical protein